ncbi:hypothetical protein QBC39DRAFT_277444 [Podospora conica]|nr:hypothetical protein QBC39DRAFT_277444 [Schizothecium conicum]
MASDMVVAFLAALQASASVLLTIWYGVLAAQARFLDSNAAKQLSRLGVSMLLPALLMTNIGSQLDPSTITRYVPILLWALAYNLASLAVGIVCTRAFALPKWVTPAIAFNNTTSLPLLLIQALGSTGAISQLLAPDAGPDAVSAAVDRARSYLLVSSIIGNSFTFGFGGELLGAHDEDPRDELDQALRDGTSSDEETDADGQLDEETSLLPVAVTRCRKRVARSGYGAAVRVWDVLPGWAQTATARVARFVSPPVFGAVVGAVVGLVPALNRVFFNSPEEGGIFKAWLTSSVKNLGELFVTLQVIVVGVKLAIGMRGTARDGEATGRLPAPSVLLVLGMRFVVWPVVSIAVISTLVAKTDLLGDDPLLWFTMMLMPTGPPAMKLTALAEATHAEDEEKLAITKFLSLSYALSPLITPTIMLSLKACKNWM